MILSFASGYQFALYRAKLVSTNESTINSLSNDVTRTMRFVVQEETQAVDEPETKQSRGFFPKLFGNTKGAIMRTPQIWTNLNPKGIRKLNMWETNIDPTVATNNKPLMKKLLGYRKLRKTKRSSLIRKKSEKELVASGIKDNEIKRDIGKFGPTEMAASTFDEDVIDPLFNLRGMDVFLTDEPEDDAATHPWLLKSGLRDVPTFIINLVTRWGNILLYYEMSEWVNDWDIKEEENDADDIKTLKVGGNIRLRLKISYFIIRTHIYLYRTEIFKWYE